MKATYVRWILISTALGFASFFVAKTSTTVTLAQSRVQVVPFVYQTETYNFESDPHGKLIHKKLVARRSDGSEASIESVGLIDWGTSTRKVTYTTGVWANIYDLIGAKTTWHMKSNELAAMKERLRNPPANCVFRTEGDPFFVHNESLLGHEVAVIQSSTEGERGTFWRSRDLGCEELQFRYESVRPDGTLKVTSEERLVSLKIGEPDPRLFDIGSNLTEMKPSDAHRLFFQKLPIPEDEDTKRVSEQLDAKYLSGSH